MSKKICIVVITFIMTSSLLPFITKANVMDNDILYQIPLAYGPGPFSGNYTNNTWTDNDITTVQSIGSNYHITGDLQTTYSVSSIYVQNPSDTPVSTNGTLVLYDVDKAPLKTVPLITYGLNTFEKTDNVRYFTLVGNESSQMSIANLYLYETVSSPYNKVSNLRETHTHSTVTLSWDNPPSENFVSTVIKQDGVHLADVSGTSYSIIELTPETTYNYELFAKYKDGTDSESVAISVTTDEAPVIPPPEDIAQLSAEASHDRVDLSWSLPEQETFQHVNIYRDEQPEVSLFSFMAASSEEATEIFETNGTYFNDLSVEPETTYDYLLTTTDIHEQESEGVSTTVTTAAEPPPVLDGEEYTEEENGDYTVSWTSPTEGQVKVFVGGELYETVDAAEGSFTIPSADMQYTNLGNPDVSLQPVSESGLEGEVVTNPEFQDVQLPFSPGNLLAAGVDLFKIVGPFVLLALAFFLVPKIRKIIFGAFGRNKGRDPKDPISKDRPSRDPIEPKGKREKFMKERTEPRIEKPYREPRTPRQRSLISSRGSRESRLPRESARSVRPPRIPRTRGS